MRGALNKRSRGNGVSGSIWISAPAALLDTAKPAWYCNCGLADVPYTTPSFQVGMSSRPGLLPFTARTAIRETTFREVPPATQGASMTRAAHRGAKALGARHRSGPVRTPIRAPSVSEGLRPQRLLPDHGNPSLTLGALIHVSPTLGFSRLACAWASPPLQYRTPTPWQRCRSRAPLPLQ
jgi:hypothetical protein